MHLHAFNICVSLDLTFYQVPIISILRQYRERRKVRRGSKVISMISNEVPITYKG